MRKIFLTTITLLSLAVGQIAGPASAADTTSQTGMNVHEFELDNGMKIRVKEDHRAPVVISQVWYNVGGADEYSGITGVSHVLEHMMFKGTKRYPAGEFSQIIADNGGQDNAFTGQDYTAYFQTLEKSRLPIALELEADRMRNLILPEEEFIKEIEVVKEERRMRTDDNPNALTQEQLYATAFNNSAYHHPIVGWMEDLQSMTVDDLRAWYEQWYAPNNAILVVVGDVDPKEVYRLAKTHFGKHKARPLPERKHRDEPAQKGERLVVVKAAAKVPYMTIGYKTPALTSTETANAEKSWEPYALSVLAAVLDGGKSSRLQKHLVREQELAASISAYYNEASRYEDLFIIDASPAQGHTLDKVEQAIYDEITRLQDTLVSEDELKRVQAQVLAQEIYRRDSINHQSYLIGMLETVGLGWQLMDGYANAIKSVTAEQIREVARKYLIPQHRTVVVMQPETDQPKMTTVPGTKDNQG